MPSRKTPDGDFKDIAHPINMTTRTMIQDAVLDKYNAVLLEEEFAASEAVMATEEE